MHHDTSFFRFYNVTTFCAKKDLMHLKKPFFSTHFKENFFFFHLTRLRKKVIEIQAHKLWVIQLKPLRHKIVCFLTMTGFEPATFRSEVWCPTVRLHGLFFNTCLHFIRYTIWRACFRHHRSLEIANVDYFIKNENCLWLVIVNIRVKFTWSCCVMIFSATFRHRFSFIQKNFISGMGLDLSANLTVASKQKHPILKNLTYSFYTKNKQNRYSF